MLGMLPHVACRMLGMLPQVTCCMLPACMHGARVCEPPGGLQGRGRHVLSLTLRCPPSHPSPAQGGGPGPRRAHPRERGLLGEPAALLTADYRVGPGCRERPTPEQAR